MNSDQELVEARWNELLDAIENYAYGPGEAGLDYLEGVGIEPPTATAGDVFNLAYGNGFDLAMAVKALRDSISQHLAEPSD